MLKTLYTNRGTNQKIRVGKTLVTGTMTSELMKKKDQVGNTWDISSSSVIIENINFLGIL